VTGSVSKAQNWRPLRMYPETGACSVPQEDGHLPEHPRRSGAAEGRRRSVCPDPSANARSTGFPSAVLRRKGATLILLVLFAAVVLSGLMMASVYLQQSTRRLMTLELITHGQAENAAKAGLVDGLCWFRRRTSQPVLVFDPARDLGSDPPVNETDDPDIGLVREYQISTRDHIFGRYEVRKRAVRDITAERALSGAGRNWYIEAKGYVYRRLVDDDAYDPLEFYQSYELADGSRKNKLADGSYELVDTVPDGILQERHDETLVSILDSVVMSTELGRMSVVLPEGATVVDRASDVKLHSRAKVDGHDSYGVLYPSGTGSIWKHSMAQLNGSPPKGGADPSTWSLETRDVFGVTADELRTIADVYTDDPSTLPDVIPDNSIVFIEGNVTWNSSRPLEGSGVLYVNGNITIAANSGSYWTGIIYSTGKYHQNAPMIVNGAVVCRSLVDIVGSGDYSVVEYDRDAVQGVLKMISQYRFNMPFFFTE